MTPPFRLGILGSARVAPAGILSTLPLIHDLRSTDHSGSSSTLIDRCYSGGWQGNGTVAVTSAATPGGKSALTFSGSSFYRNGDPGFMLTGMDPVRYSASSQFNIGSSQYDPSNIGGVAGDWASVGNTMPQWWRVDLSSAKTVTSYSVSSGQGARAPRDWLFQGSNDDGANWTTLDSRTAQPSQGLTTFTIATPAAYTSYRLYVTAINGGDLLYLTRMDLTGVTQVGSSRSNVEHWLVLKSTLNGSAFPVHFSASGDTRYPFTDGTIYTTWGAAGRYSYAPTLSPLNTWRTFRISQNSGTIKHYLDAVLQNTTTSGPSFFKRSLFGKGGSGNYTGQIAHSLIISRNLTDPEAASLESELRSMWF